MCIVQKAGVGRVLMHKKLQEFAGDGGDVVPGRKGAGKRAGWRGESAKALRTGMFDFLSRLGMLNF